jgi:hypothetical protein
MEAQTEEEWRDVVGYEGEYEVSNLGRVRRLPKTIVDSCRGGKRRRFSKAKIIKRTISKTGYYTVALGKRNVKLHRVIAEAFIPNPEGKETVNHINGDKLDNRSCNLEWATQSEQELHKYRVLGCKPAGFSKEYMENHKRKIECVETGVVYESAAEVGRQLRKGADTSCIVAVCKGRKYHLTAWGYHWRYADGN